MAKTKLFLTLALILSLTLVAACTSNSPKATGPVAIVNGIEISREVYNDELEFYTWSYEQDGLELTDENLELIKSHVLDNLITTALLLQAAEAAGITEETVDIEIVMEEIVAEFDSSEELAEALELEGYTYEEYRKVVLEFLIVEELFERELDFDSIEIAEEEVQERYSFYFEDDEELTYDEIRDYLLYDMMSEAENALIDDYIMSLWDKAEIEYFDL